MKSKYNALMRQIEELTKRAAKLRSDEAAKIGNAVKAVKALMAKHGLTVAHLGAVASAAKAKAVIVKSPVSAKSAAAKPTAAKPAAKPAAAKPASKLKSTDKRLKVKAKYRNKKTGDTWAGRGKQPRWMTAELKAGKKRDDFLVTKA